VIITSFEPTWMGADVPWFVQSPEGQLVRKVGGGFVQFETEGEAQEFADRLDRGEIRISRDGRVPAEASS